MVKIYHRPDPPPPDVDSNRAVRRTDTFLNKEASAGLFLKALAKVQGQEQAVEQSKQSDAGQQQQIESDSNSMLGAKTRDSLQASRNETNDSPQTQMSGGPGNAALNAVEAEDIAELQATPDESIDADSAEEDEQVTELAPSSDESPPKLDSNAAYQMFENIQNLNSSVEPEAHTDTNTTSQSLDNEQDVTATAPSAVAHSAASTAASFESRINSMSSMSELIDMLETASQLPDGNEWTLLLEDDGPVSELKLSSDSDGRWNIDLLTSFDNEAVDDDMINNLRHQLDTAGVAVANIALVDTAAAESTSAQPASATDNGVNNIV